MVTRSRFCRQSSGRQDPTSGRVPGSPSAQDSGTDRSTDRARCAVASVTDPEIPVLTIDDLGILRDISVADDNTVTVTITPTYSGCPAMSQITADITAVLADAGFDRVKVQTSLSPAWTTDWMTGEGKRKLEEYGIAPPTRRTTDSPAGPVPLALGLPVRQTGPVVGTTAPDRPRCPRCRSANTRELTRFSSTSCKSLHVCNDCREPFDYFKVH